MAALQSLPRRRREHASPKTQDGRSHDRASAGKEYKASQQRRLWTVADAREQLDDAPQGRTAFAV